MAEDPLTKAQGLMAEAEQKLNVQPGGCCGKGGRVKVEEACALYGKAAISFKLAKDWGSAGHAFAKAAAQELENKRPHEAGNHFVEASKCYKKVSAGESAKCLERAVEVYTDMGKQRTAAKHHQTLAELYDEGELMDYAKSVYHNSKAAELFSGEESKSAAYKCQLQVAKNSALLGNHAKSVEIYETLGKEALESNLLKYTAIDMFFRAGLCKLYIFTTTDAENTADMMRNVIVNYDDLCPAFPDSRERTLLMKLSEAVSEKDVDAFNDGVRNHESVSRLDAWYHEIIKSTRKYVMGEDLR